MKRIGKKILVSTLAASLFFGNCEVAEAIQISVGETEQIVEDVLPSVMVTGDLDDIESTNSYHILATEQEKQNIVVPVTVTSAGLVSCNIMNDCMIATGVSASGAGITVGVYADEACTQCLKDEQTSECNDIGDMVYQASFEVETGGIYYIRLSVDPQIQTGDGKYMFTMDLQQVSSADRTLSDGEYVKAYQSGSGSVIYYKIKTRKSGVLTVDAMYDSEDPGSPKLTLCNAKKKAITVSASNNAASNYTSVFAVSKGTYYLKVANVKGTYQLRYEFSAVSDKSGSKKSKAKTITIGKTGVKGMVLAGDQKSKYDWYKFKLKKKSKIKIVFSGSTTGNSKLKAEVMPAASKIKIDQDAAFTITGIDDSRKASSDVWPAGTWYIRVSKDMAKGSGTYAIKVYTTS